MEKERGNANVKKVEVGCIEIGVEPPKNPNSFLVFSLISELPIKSIF